MNQARRRAGAAAILCGALLWLNLRRDIRWTIAGNSWQPVARHTLEQTVKSPGIVEAARVKTLKAEVNESVAKKPVQEGDHVKTGQVLLELTRAATSLEYEQKSNGLESAKYDLAKAKKELSLQRRLFEKQAVPFKNVEDAKSGLDKAKAAFKIAEREFALARDKLDKTVVRSPMDGVILKDHTLGKDNEKVKADDELFLIGDTSRFVVRAKVDELDIPKVRVGQKAMIEVDAYPGLVVRGAVRSIAPQAERKTYAKVDVLIDVTETGGATLKHNLSVSSYLSVEEIPRAIALPLQAVRRGPDGERALVLDGRGRLRLRALRLGRPAQKEIEVLSGVEEGEQVAAPKVQPRERPGF